MCEASKAMFEASFKISDDKVSDDQHYVHEPKHTAETSDEWAANLNQTEKGLIFSQEYEKYLAVFVVEQSSQLLARYTDTVGKRQLLWTPQEQVASLWESHNQERAKNATSKDLPKGLQDRTAPAKDGALALY